MKKPITLLFILIILAPSIKAQEGFIINKHLEEIKSTTSNPSILTSISDSSFIFSPTNLESLQKENELFDLTGGIESLNLDFSSVINQIDQKKSDHVVDSLIKIKDSLFSVIKNLNKDKAMNTFDAVKKDYKELSDKIADIDKANEIFKTDSLDKIFNDSTLSVEYRNELSRQDSSEMHELKTLEESIGANTKRIEFILEGDIDNSALKKIDGLLNASSEGFKKCRLLTTSIQDRINKYKKLIETKKKIKDNKFIDELNSMPGVIIPTSSAQIIPSLNLLGSRYIVNENGGSSHTFLFYISKDFNLNTDSLKAENIYQKAATNYFIPEASSLGIFYKYSRSFFFSKDEKKDNGAFSLRFFFLNKPIPIKIIEDSTVKYNGSDNVSVFHGKVGMEYYIIKDIFNIYFNYNIMFALNNSESYENFFNASARKARNFADVGANISLSSKEANNSFAIQLGMIIQTSDVKDFTLNKDIGIPTIKLAYTFDKLINR